VTNRPRPAEAGRYLLLLLLAAAGCGNPPRDPNVLVVAVQSGPNNLDPRIGTDSVSQNIDQLMFNGILKIDEHLKMVPDLAETFENPEPTVYVATLRKGVRFHDGHELTSADVVYTFRSLFDPAMPNPYPGALRDLKSVEARDRYTVVFTLKQPWGSFPANLYIPGIVPDGAGREFGQHPIGTGPYRFVKHVADDRIEVAPFKDYFDGAPRNNGLVFKVIPDSIMTGLELRRGTTDLIVNDPDPDIVHQLEKDPKLRTERSAGADFQYIGTNLLDPILKDVRVRRALSHAIDRKSIIEYLRRGLAVPADGLLPRESWAYDPSLPSYDYDPAKARALLDEAGYPDPDGDGPAMRMQLTLKIQNLEFPRLQGTVIQQNLRAVGVDVDVRSYEFATLYQDVLNGNFQLYTLQWAGGATTDPDILRRIFHSSQVPPAGFNRGHFSDPHVDALLDEASRATDDARRKVLFGEAQRAIAEQVPYICLWTKINNVIGQRTLDGMRVTPIADYVFLKDVSRRTN
jgi:peptide/nickel transport system substrate-binding protein